MSSTTQAGATAKIKLAHKIAQLAFLTATVFLLLLNMLSNKDLSCIGTKISFNKFNYCAEVADDAEKRALGLSGRALLKDNQAKLFIFESEDHHGIWMKDMNFDIDIVWLDNNKQVVHIEKDVKPSSYPEVFYPKLKSKYVVELAAGAVSKNGLSIGDKFNW